MGSPMQPNRKEKFLMIYSNPVCPENLLKSRTFASNNHLEEVEVLRQNPNKH
jgi:hypothetical protein